MARNYGLNKVKYLILFLCSCSLNNNDFLSKNECQNDYDCYGKKCILKEDHKICVSPNFDTEHVINSSLESEKKSLQIKELQIDSEQNIENISIQLKKLKNLKDLGILTNDEYEIRRASLVNKIN